MEEGEPLTTESFLLCCYQCGLTRADVEEMTIAMCLDYIDAYVQFNQPPEEKVVQASQAHFDAF